MFAASPVHDVLTLEHDVLIIYLQFSLHTHLRAGAASKDKENKEMMESLLKEWSVGESLCFCFASVCVCVFCALFHFFCYCSACDVKTQNLMCVLILCITHSACIITYYYLTHHTPFHTLSGASMSAGGGGDGEGGADGEGYGADQQGEDDQINEMMAGSDAELQVSDCAACSACDYIWRLRVNMPVSFRGSCLGGRILQDTPELFILTSRAAYHFHPHHTLQYRCTSRWTWSTSRTAWPSGSRCTRTSIAATAAVGTGKYLPCVCCVEHICVDNPFTSIDTYIPSSYNFI